MDIPMASRTRAIGEKKIRLFHNGQSFAIRLRQHNSMVGLTRLWGYRAIFASWPFSDYSNGLESLSERRTQFRALVPGCILELQAILGLCHLRRFRD